MYVTLDLSKVQFSLNDKRRGIIVPNELNAELAEDIGFHLGDGYMNEYSMPSNPHKYDFVYSGHAVDDKPYYENILLQRKLKLFNIKPKIRITNNEIRIRILSKAILTYFRDVIGVCSGNKLHAKIPEIIMKSDKKNKVAFLRGLYDADGSMIFLKKYKKFHYYPTIRIGLISKSIIYNLKDLLRHFNFTFTLFSKLPHGYTSDTKIQFCIDINGVKNCEKWIELIGFNNQKHLMKYKIWKRFGFCPPSLDVEKCKKILYEKLSPYDFYNNVDVGRARFEFASPIHKELLAAFTL